MHNFNLNLSILYSTVFAIIVLCNMIYNKQIRLSFVILDSIKKYY